MFKKIFNSFSSFERFSIKLLFYFILTLMVMVGYTFGFTLLSRPDDTDTFLGGVTLLFSTMLGFFVGVKFYNLKTYGDGGDDNECSK